MSKRLYILLPGFLDSPEYLHMQYFSEQLLTLGHGVIVVDPCDLWLGNGKIEDYSITNYLKQVQKIIEENMGQEIVLLGHSMGAFIALIIASKNPNITKIITISPPYNLSNSTLKWDKNGFRISKREESKNLNKFREFKVPVSYLNDALSYKLDNFVPKIEIPIVLVICLGDSVIDPEETSNIVHLNPLNIEVLEINELGHDFRKDLGETKEIWSELGKFIN